MSRYREIRCVTKAPGCAASVALVREGYEYESLGPVIASRPFDGFARQLLAWTPADGDAFTGPIVITGLCARGGLRSLEAIEAQQIAMQLRGRALAPSPTPGHAGAGSERVR